MIMAGACQCGTVKIELGESPEFVNDCNCSFCETAAAFWGYFDPQVVQVTGKTNTYVREDRLTPAVEIHSCVVCSDTTHWTLTKAYQISTGITDNMGVNMRLFSDSDLQGVEMKFPDGKAWSGQGEYGFRKPAIIIGQ